jgi:hypothetical protein
MKDRPRFLPTRACVLSLFAFAVLSLLSVAPSLVAVRSEPQVKLSPKELDERQNQADNDPVQILELCPLADEIAAKKLRVLAGKLLQEAAAADRPELARKVALVLADAVRTADAPEAVRDILGAPQKISRQVIYRRCLEQWIYHHPVPLCVAWSIAHGMRPSVYSVLPIRIEKQ